MMAVTFAAGLGIVTSFLISRIRVFEDMRNSISQWEFHLLAFMTRSAGFVGSNLADSLLEKRFAVTGYGNFPTGFSENLHGASQCAGFNMIQGYILNLPALTKAMIGCYSLSKKRES